MSKTVNFNRWELYLKIDAEIESRTLTLLNCVFCLQFCTQINSEIDFIVNLDGNVLETANSTSRDRVRGVMENISNATSISRQHI